MEPSEHNWANISETICSEMLVFHEVGLLDLVLSEYPDKSHNFTNLFFMTSHFRTLYSLYSCDILVENIFKVICGDNVLVFLVYSLVLVYSRLSLNGHLYKTDTSVKRTLRVGPCQSFYSFYLTLYKTDTSLRRTLSAGPEGVHLRES